MEATAENLPGPELQFHIQQRFARRQFNLQHKGGLPDRMSQLNHLKVVTLFQLRCDQFPRGSVSEVAVKGAFWISDLPRLPFGRPSDAELGDAGRRPTGQDHQLMPDFGLDQPRRMSSIAWSWNHMIILQQIKPSTLLATHSHDIDGIRSQDRLTSFAGLCTRVYGEVWAGPLVHTLRDQRWQDARLLSQLSVNLKDNRSRGRATAGGDLLGRFHLRRSGLAGIQRVALASGILSDAAGCRARRRDCATHGGP